MCRGGDFGGCCDGEEEREEKEVKNWGLGVLLSI